MAKLPEIIFCKEYHSTRRKFVPGHGSDDLPPNARPGSSRAFDILRFGNPQTGLGDDYLEKKRIATQEAKRLFQDTPPFNPSLKK